MATRHPGHFDSRLVSGMNLPDNTQLSGREALNVHIKAPYFKALYNAPIPVLILREDGLFLLINRAFQKATGLSPESMPTIDVWAEKVHR